MCCVPCGAKERGARQHAAAASSSTRPALLQVDVVLDSAASGINTVEREGISIVHPARFIMIGSGNPGEGEMRPQLLDRFGMSVQVQCSACDAASLAHRSKCFVARRAGKSAPVMSQQGPAVVSTSTPPPHRTTSTHRPASAGGDLDGCGPAHSDGAGPCWV
jgi:hypothetical protein